MLTNVSEVTKQIIMNRGNSSEVYHILLLQGPVGPFMRDLQATFVKSGHTADHVLFNAGDRLYSAQNNTINYRTSDDNWEGWLLEYFRQKPTNAVVLFGCERPRHEIARRVADSLNILVISLDEGYVRPGYVTVERGGNNRLSPLRNLTSEQLKHRPNKKRPAPARGHSFNQMTFFGCFYYIARYLGYFFYPGPSHHKYRPVFSEAFYWFRNLIRKILWRSRNFQCIDELLDSYFKKYYLVPLQVRDDMQLTKADAVGLMKA